MSDEVTHNKYFWEVQDGSILCYLGSNLLFEDTLDHWQNGVCRLLKLPDQNVRNWVEYCLGYSTSMSIIELIEASNEFFSVEQISVNKIDNSIVYAESVEGDETLSVVGSPCGKHATLRNSHSGLMADPPQYTEEYFEHGTNARKGYGDLLAQSEWRIEKAYRFYNLVTEKINEQKFKNRKYPKVLDVGSGYGHMRLPFEKNGYTTCGLEISEFAAKVAKENYNLETIVGDFSELKVDDKFGIVLCYDIIEHVTDPNIFIGKLNKLLEVSGYLVIRTPNLRSLESRVFGQHFHSYKLEHLNYFSVESLSTLLMKYGFDITSISTFSHLFNGFKCVDTPSLERAHLGSDIFCIARKKLNA